MAENDIIIINYGRRQIRASSTDNEAAFEKTCIFNRRNEERGCGVGGFMRSLTIAVWCMFSMVRTRMHYDTAYSHRANIVFLTL